ncbi:hypothetical protein ABPG77_006729 [Micractinium sp. CCAP 211/92]
MLHRLPAAVPRLALQSLLVAATAAAAAVFAGAGAAGAAFAAGNGSEPGSPRNVYGGELGLCSTSPMTGYFRDGRCDTGPMDYGTHTVCAKVTNEFLQYTLHQGNDLITPRPEYRFPGLKDGDGWCLCAARWREALAAGVAPPFVGLSELENHAAGAGGSGSTATQ